MIFVWKDAQDLRSMFEASEDHIKWMALNVMSYYCKRAQRVTMRIQVILKLS